MNKKVQLGLLAVVSLVILYFGFNFLKGEDLFVEKNRFYIIYNDIGGLAESNPVNVNGYVVGMVDEIEILFEEQNKLRVWINIDDKVQVGDGTKAELSSSVIGGMSIKLILDPNTRLFESGSQLEGIKSQTMAEVLNETAVPIIDSLDLMMSNVSESINKADSLEIKSAFSEISETTNALRLAMSKLYKYKNQYDKQLMSSATKLNATLLHVTAINDTMVAPLIAQVRVLADSLHQLQPDESLKNINKTMSSLNTSILQLNSNYGAFGQLINVDTTHNELMELTQRLDSLFVAIDEQAQLKKRKKKKE